MPCYQCFTLKKRFLSRPCKNGNQPMLLQKHFKIKEYKKKSNGMKENQLTAGPLGARAIDSHQKHLAELGQEKNQLWQGQCSPTKCDSSNLFFGPKGSETKRVFQSLLFSCSFTQAMTSASGFFSTESLWIALTAMSINSSLEKTLSLCRNSTICRFSSE